MLTSGVGVGVVLGPGTAGDVVSFGRTGAGVIVSGFDVGVGVDDLSRLQADSESAVSNIQLHRARRVVVIANLWDFVKQWSKSIFSQGCAHKCQ